MELFKLLGTIAIDNANANKALEETSGKARKTAEDIGGVSDSGNKTSGKFAAAMGKVGGAAVKVGKVVATGMVAAGTAIGGVTIKALSSAGELEQNMGGSEAVFGEYAAKMQNTAKTAFSNMGLSASDFLGTANKMGALFQGAGFGIEESATMSAEAMQRAADVASIMGIDTASAMEAVAGAAKGNFTMMDNLGVAMNDTAIQNYAVTKGINKTTAEMTQQEKIGLAMEMFMEKTAYAAGNYAKENETLAGSLGTAKAALSNFLSGSGTVEDVVSSFKNAGSVIVKNIKELFPALMTGITQLVTQLVPEIPPLLEQLLPSLLNGATGLINGLVAAMPMIISALMSALPALIEGVTSIVNALVAALPQIMEALMSALPALLPQLINGLVSMIVMLCSNFAQIIQPIIDYLPEIIVSVVNALIQNLPALIKGVIDLVGGLIKALPQIWNALVKAIETLLRGWISALGKWVAPIVGKIKEWWEGVKKATLEKWNAIKATVSNAFNGIKSVATNVWNGIKNAITKPIEKARDTIKGIVDKIKGFFTGLKLKFPDVKLPHFKIKPSGWKIGDLLKGSIPKLGIDWYAKAMNNPMLMDSPTIFGYNPKTGNVMGGGENGSEVVSGTNTLMNMIGDAVENKTAAQNERIIAVLLSILNAIVGGNKEMLRAVLADKTFAVGEREFARLVKQYA